MNFPGLPLDAVFGSKQSAHVQSQAAQTAMSQAKHAYELMKVAFDQARQAHDLFSVGKLSLEQLVRYQQQAQGSADMAIHAQTYAEQQFISAGGQGATSWDAPTPIGGWDGLKPDQIREVYVASTGNVLAAQQRWAGNHGAGSG